MRAIRRNYLFLVLCAASFGAGSAAAQNRPQPPDGRPGGEHPGPQRKPPEAAFSACDKLEEDDVCEVDLGDRTIEGKCVPARDAPRLLCQPDNPHGPPPPARQ